MPEILVTGGTGLIGSALVHTLKEAGYQTKVLTRSAGDALDPGYYRWDPASGRIDPRALEQVDSIVHLAGINIGSGRWTARRKKAILESRISTGELLLKTLSEHGEKLPTAFITASATGYYGGVTGDHIFEESDPPAGDFLGQTCRRWETVADRFQERGVRTLRIRTGVVLSGEGGMLSRLRFLFRTGLGTGQGDGRQYLPWIHLHDLCNIYLRAVEDQTMEGAFNAVAPDQVSNRDFMRQLADTMKRPFWLPNIPSVLLRIVFGEMSVMLLKGSRVSSEKLLSTGFRFTYPDLESALDQIYS